MEEGSDTPSLPSWYHRPAAVLLMLFVVLGPLGLPLLWKSPAFPRWAKIGLTVAVLVYTLALLDGALSAIRTALDQLEMAGLPGRDGPW